MNFAEWCREDWPNHERAEEFLIRAAERVGFVSESVGISESKSTTDDILASYKPDGTLDLTYRSVTTDAAELVYGMGLITIGQAANRDNKKAPPESWTPKNEHKSYTTKAGRGLTKYVRMAKIAADRTAGAATMAKVYPGAVDVMATAIERSLLPENFDAVLEGNPMDGALRFDSVLSEIAAQAVAGEVSDDPRRNEAAELMKLGLSSSPGKIADLVLDICKDMGQIEDKFTDTANDGGEGVPCVEYAQTQAQYDAKIMKGLGGKSSGVSTEKWATDNAHPSKRITQETTATAIFREVMTEDRIERESGHYSGLVAQPTRMFSDYRMMSRRLVQEEVPDSLFVSLTDSSGSMDGERWRIACEIHDGVMKAFHDLNIPAISAAFDQWGGDRLFPVCKMGAEPVMLSSAASPSGGTGDLGAIHWATRQLDAAGKKGRVVLVVSDSEGPTEPAKMKRALQLLNANVVHVDVTGRGIESYGVKPISLTKVTDEFYRDLASRLRHALELQGDVEG